MVNNQTPTVTLAVPVVLGEEQNVSDDVVFEKAPEPYDVTCDVCGRVLGTSDRSDQKGFECGPDLGTHLDGSDIKPPQLSRKQVDDTIEQLIKILDQFGYDVSKRDS